MVYTNQELKDAFCTATGTDPADLVDKKVEIQAELDERRARLTSRIAQNTEKAVELQVKLDDIPTIAKDKMKSIAINYLINQIREQTKIDNNNIDL